LKRSRDRKILELVVPELVRGLHVFADGETGKDADGRDKPGHDHEQVQAVLM
jgi:hypothetical protein